MNKFEFDGLSKLPWYVWIVVGTVLITLITYGRIRYRDDKKQFDLNVHNSEIPIKKEALCHDVLQLENDTDSIITSELVPIYQTLLGEERNSKSKKVIEKFKEEFLYLILIRYETLPRIKESCIKGQTYNIDLSTTKSDINRTITNLKNKSSITE